MIHVSIHAGRLSGISRFNRLDWLDIAYERLNAQADYKVVLFRVGEGATPPIDLKDYPRWSGSLWDLVARAIVLATPGETAPASEALPPYDPQTKRYGYADALSAVIQYKPTIGTAARQLASMEIREASAPGIYRVTVSEDLLPSHSALPFTFRPKYLSPSELVARAAAMALHGDSQSLPSRPALQIPKSREIDGEPMVVIHRLREPARTGFLRWLHKAGRPVKEVAGARDGAASEALFLKFLQEAV